MKRQVPLANQLILISLIVFLILTISLTVFLPRALLPYFEETVYNFLDQPLQFFNHNDESKFFNESFHENIVFIQVDTNNNMIISGNANQILKTDNYENVLDKTKEKKGTFTLNGSKYFYVTNNTTNIIRITITDETFINSIRSRVLISILPIIIITFLVILIALLIWCNFVVHKIYILKNKVRNMNDDNYDHRLKIRVEDELKLLEETIENVRIVLKEQENYKNEMYQNISHDFKTPISVIKSYMEALDDGITNNKETIEVVNDQITILDKKVKSLLQLNKLAYLKEHFSNTDIEINIVEIINERVKILKNENKKINWRIDCKKSEINYKGTKDMWESIIDNLLSNFIRYAKNSIVIEITSKKLVLFNDGERIDENIMNDMFSPYKKGMKGQTGLGLSIVQKTCRVLGFDVRAENVKNGVQFIIEKH